jgi:uncharacterized protein
MDEMLIGEKLQIQCYKHNGKIHRAWDEAVVIDIKDDYIVCGNNKTIVIESEGNVWKTKEPAIMFFFKKRWFNIIAQLKKDGIYFYCNIASPYLIEEKTIKYIDYDLDLRVFPQGEYKILDKMEYQYHKKIMHYSDELDQIIHNSMDELIKCYESENIIFNKEEIYNYHRKYRTIATA